MKKKLVFQSPTSEIIDLVLMDSPLCTSNYDLFTSGGDSGNGLNDYEYEEW